MNRNKLIKQMMTGMIPLLVFIVIDEVWGTQAGLIAAIVIGLGQLSFIYYRERKIERFILLDTGLIVMLGGVSLLSHNDLFIKIKPALIEGIMALLLAFSVYGPRNLILEMQKRYTGELTLNEEQNQLMIRQIKIMLWVVIAHIVMILYSAFYMSTEAWGFISTALLYILFGLIFLWQFLMLRKKKKETEWLPVVDSEGRVKGKATREACMRDKSLIHPVVRLHIFNSKGELFLQKRSLDADIQPGKWDCAVAGHVKYGETVEEALRREAMEELNLSTFNFQPAGRSLYEGPTTTALMFIFASVVDEEISPNPAHTAGGRFFPFNRVKTLLREEEMSPGLLEEWPLLIKLYRGLKSKR